ncbi:MAG: TrmB family transcriptional regulator [Candidatus Heimdallarchaeaceae archaeon]
MNTKSPPSFSKDDAITALSSLGLARGEAKTYTSLVGMGPTHASTIARIANVPQPKVYGFLERLVERTFVTRQEKEGIPDTFMAVPYEIVIESLESQFQSKLKVANRYFEKVKEEQRTREVDDLFSYFEGKKAVYAGLKNIINNMQTNVVFLLLSSEDEEMMQNLMTERKKSRSKIDILYLQSSEKLQKIPPLRKLMKNRDFQNLLAHKLSVFYVDVDFEKNTCSSMNMVFPSIEPFGQVLINVKHPIALNAQLQLISSIIDALQNLGLKISELKLK